VDETFTVNLANAAGNATIANGHALGTIVNDDRKHAKRARTLGRALNAKTGTARPAVLVPAPPGSS
jgi:hypothetical protein